jgi:hypothetical protein
VKVENGDLFADSHSIINNTFLSCIKSMYLGREVHTAEPETRGPSQLEADTATANLKKY